MAIVNHHRSRNKKINLEMISNGCPQCSNKEDWEYIVKCPMLLEEKRAFLRDLCNKLQKEDK